PESCIFLDAHNSEKPHELSFSMSVFSVEKSKYGCSTRGISPPLSVNGIRCSAVLIWGQKMNLEVILTVYLRWDSWVKSWVKYRQWRGNTLISTVDLSLMT
ncbi:hypothetical protein, partial [Photorhabdus sp. RM157S]|uniref:hypothetical protein n=1 Tax=Photorhabdus sp. RM157S TaxID=3342827 RepID=UPI0036DF460B